MNFTDIINSAEELYKDLLESFFSGIYPLNKLMSHGLDHHKRVWGYAKELLQYTDNPDKLFIEKLIIACFLHDIGMSTDPGINHGFHSKKLTERFLSENNLRISDFQDVLEAIENHDNKDYDNSGAKTDLQTLLSVADDLDAFGYIGIYRYLEIYLERGVSQHLIGQVIRDNALKRFKNFELTFGKYPDLLEKHKNRYMILDNFFAGLISEYKLQG